MHKEFDMAEHNNITLIIGGSSYIGQAMCRTLNQQKEKYIVTSRLPNGDNLFLDLEQENVTLVLKKILADHNVNQVLFLAAITGEKQCQNSPAKSYFVNVTQTQKVLKLLDSKAIFTVFMSSSLVFDHGTEFINVASSHQPKTMYGQHKSEVEQFINSQCQHVSVIRVGKVIGANFPLFEQIVQSATNGSEVSLFHDHFCAPISLTYLCQLVTQVLLSQQVGLYQCSGNEDISYADMAKRLVEHCQLKVKINEISAYEKNITPERYGSLSAFSSSAIEINAQPFSSVLEDYLSTN